MENVSSIGAQNLHAIDILKSCAVSKENQAGGTCKGSKEEKVEIDGAFHESSERKLGWRSTARRPSLVEQGYSQWRVIPKQ